MSLNTISMKEKLLTIFFMIASVSSFAQNQVLIDSLSSVLETSISDKNKLEVYEELIYHLAEMDMKRSLGYVKKGQQIAIKIKDKEEELYFKYLEGYVYYSQWDFEKGIAIFQDVLNQIEDDKMYWLQTYCLKTYADAHWYQSNYDSAIHYYEQALNSIQKGEGLRESQKILLAMGETYCWIHNYDQAGIYFEKYLKVCESLEDEAGIANYYHYMSMLRQTESRFEEAVSLSKESLKRYRQLGSNLHIGRCNTVLGKIYIDSRKYKLGIDFLLEAEYFYKKYKGSSYPMLQVYASLGEAYFNLNDYKQALFFYNKGLTFAGNSGDRQLINDLLLGVGKTLKAQGNNENAIELFENSLDIARNINDNIGVAISLGNLGSVYRLMHKPERTLAYFKEGLQLSQKYELHNHVASFSYQIGISMMELEQEDSASVYFNQSFQSIENTNDYLRLAAVYQEIGEWYHKRSKIPQALKYYYDALEILEERKDTLGIARVNSNISKVHESQLNGKEAVQYQNKALALYRTIKDTSGIASATNDLAVLYRGEKQYEKSLELSNQSLGNFRQLGDSCRFSKCYLSIGKTYFLLNQLDSAIYHLKQAQEQAEKCGDYEILASTKIELGKVYQEAGESDLSFKAYEKALELAKISQNREILKEAAEVLYPIYEQRGQIDKAYETLKIYRFNNESLFNDANTSALVQKELEYQYDKEKALFQKEKEVELEKQQWMIYTSIATCFALIGISLAVYRNYRNKHKANQLLRIKNDEISRQKEELEALDHTKSRFFTNISHELRTPLTLISSPLQTLINHSQESFLTSTKETLQLIFRNTQSLKGLVNDILDLSKLESDKIELHEEEVPIRFLLNRIASNYDSLAQHQNIRYKQSFEKLPDEVVLVDVGKIEKVLNNLLSNAIKHSHAEDLVDICAKVEGDRLQVEVRDTGQGIPEADLPFIFERFYQSKQPDAPIQGGTGIGLALAKELTRLMKGEISVESEVGKGSLFTLSLPYQLVGVYTEKEVTGEMEEVVEQEEISLAYLETGTQANVGKQYKVLIVEDHPDMQRYINSLIEPNHSTLLAANGKQALKILEQESIDLIISDVMMPEMDGYSLLLHLKGSDAYRRIPVIMLTALGDEAHKLQALTIGVDDYLTKPFSPQELLVRVHNLLGRHAARLRWQEDEKANTEVPDVFSAGNRDASLELCAQEADVQWLKEIEKVIAANLENENFSLKDLANQFNLSLRQFQRNIKKVTGLTPKQYQREIALQKARKLLENGSYQNTTAIAYSIGMNHVSRFSKLYEARFGKKPSDYFMQKVEVIN
jgi:signal transduction histidine kinase/DNA-binding response OmpR family regulator